MGAGSRGAEEGDKEIEYEKKARIISTERIWIEVSDWNRADSKYSLFHSDYFANDTRSIT